TAFDKVHTQYTKIGAISSTGQTASNDAREELIKKQMNKGGVIVPSSGNTDKKMHVATRIYKKK
ncbi:TPA: hypothetical protein OXE90_005089, partial [Klebsiella pneumoniae]|nr:hypothetical protein [Klebsiella pneumoniae]